MKNILYLLAIFFMIDSVYAEENLTPQKLAERQAKTIYEEWFIDGSFLVLLFHTVTSEE